jgi:hypothetical protein
MQTLASFLPELLITCGRRTARLLIQEQSGKTMADTAKEDYSVATATVREASTTPSAGNTAEEGIWSAIKEALRGSHRNYTVGPIGRSIILLAIPMVLEMFMEVFLQL